MWSGIEVVITALTRNQVTGNRPWVRIPPAPPSTRLKRRFQAGFRMLGAIRNRRSSYLRGWFLVMSSILRKSLRHKDFLGVMSVFCSPNYFTILMPLWILERKRIPCKPLRDKASQHFIDSQERKKHLWFFLSWYLWTFRLLRGYRYCLCANFSVHQIPT